MGPKDNKVHSNHFQRFYLGLLVTLYCLLNFILFIFSCIAWSTLKKRAREPDCKPIDNVHCGPARWMLYSFIATVSGCCSIISGIVAIKTWAGAKGAPLDTQFVFRGVTFTLLALAPLVYIGWTNLQVIARNPSSSNNVAAWDPSSLKMIAIGNLSSLRDIAAGNPSPLNLAVVGNLNSADLFAAWNLSSLHDLAIENLSSLSDVAAGNSSFLNDIDSENPSSLNIIFAGNLSSLSDLATGNLSSLNIIVARNLSSLRESSFRDVAAWIERLLRDVHAGNLSWLRDVAAATASSSRDATAGIERLLRDFHAENLSWLRDVAAATGISSRDVVTSVSACMAGDCDEKDFPYILGCSQGKGCASAAGVDPGEPSFGGIGGTFILEMLDHGVQSSRVACGLTHFTLFFGIFVAGMAAAMASVTSVPAGAQELSGMT